MVDLAYYRKPHKKFTHIVLFVDFEIPSYALKCIKYKCISSTIPFPDSRVRNIVATLLRVASSFLAIYEVADAIVGMEW